MKKIWIYGALLLLLIILIFGAFLAYATWKDYQPKPREIVFIEDRGMVPADTELPDTLTALIWNIGYGGLGAETDFFFDGGRMVRPSLELARNYLDNICRFLGQMDSVDFLLLQEVDVHSRRSFYTDQVERISQAMPGRVFSFAKNYDAWFVPQPITQPYGRVVAGLMSLARHRPALATRIALKPDATWPTGLFMLDRCLLEWRFPVGNGKDLIVYNLHLSAYDDGDVKQNQMDSLRQIFLREYAQGHYIIAGGDWNQNPPGYEPSSHNPHLKPTTSVPEIFPAEGWHWAFQTEVPTNRSLQEPYRPGHTPVNVIDFFLLSPNIKLLEVKGLDLGFQDSDHQPVGLRCVLNRSGIQ
ncbi:MAG: hypothetical protein NZM15_03605 [Flavobacteriales bacterium]|nr:hypothetical protein [Flavobacteriales bacterium]MDW8431771.1 hypothetical protein [Flavobacteriales bacterium]